MRRLTAAAALVSALAACASGSVKAGLTVGVAKDPFRLTFVQDGKLLVAEDGKARLRYQLRSSGAQYSVTKVLSSSGGVYQLATNEPGRTATVTVTVRRSGFHVSLRLHPETGVQQVYDAFDTAPGDHFLGGGERGDAVDLRGQVLPVKVSNVCSYAPVPYVASSAGWAVRLATRAVSALALPGSPGGGGCRFGDEPQCAFPELDERAEVCVQGARLDEDIYAGDFAHTLAAYERDTGRPLVPPPSELALIKWRDAYDGPAQVLEDISHLRAAKVPIGWALVDNPWESCVGTLTFDPHRFPDPRGLIEQVHAQNVRFMLWVSPKSQCGIGYSRSELLGDIADQDEVDLTKPSVVAAFSARLARLASLGVDGLKADRGDEVDVESVATTLQNDYPLLYAQAVMGAFPAHTPAIFRAATMGSQRVVPGLWAGDQESTWTDFQKAVRAGETAAMSGFPTWGSDIGGYHSASLTGDLFARWAQLGAVSPVFEVGGQGANATPWTMGAGAMGALRAAAVLHYELFPYLYGLLERQQPVLRPLGYGFPADAESWQADLELLVGPDLLAAPVTGPGTTPSIYLPPGLWVDLATGETVKGPASFTRATPLDVLPLYVRAGAVVPFNLRTADSWWGVDELSHTDRAGYLVSEGSELDLRRQPPHVQLWVPAPARPARVTLAGKSVAFSWSPGPLPGVVVRVHGPTVRGQVVLHGP